MGAALRALGFVVFVAAVAGAAYGAYQVFPPEPGVSAAEQAQAAKSLQLAPLLPGVLAGDSVDVEATVHNPFEDIRAFQLSVTDGQGTPEEETLTVEPGGNASTIITVQAPDDAEGLLPLTVQATNGTDITFSRSIDIPVVAQGAIAAEPVFSSYEVAPGNRFSVPIVVLSNLGTEAPIQVGADHLVNGSLGTVAPGTALGGFAMFQAPSDLASTQTLDLEVQAGTGQADLEITLRPPGGDTEASGSHQAVVNYVGRLTDGKVFDTSVSEIGLGPFPKTDTFRPRPNPQPLSVNLDPTAGQVIEGFRSAVEGLEIGETNTAILPPSQAYGAARVHQNLSATTELQRQDEVPRFLEDFPINQLPPDFGIEEAEEGDTINYTTSRGDTTLTFRFRLIEKGEDAVTLERMEQVGDTTTFYDPWPNATEVVEVTDQTIVFETTPPEGIGAFTWDVNPNSHQAAWENATTVDQVNETAIVLSHQPEEGSTYQAASNPRAPPQTYTIHEVTDEAIHVSTSNPNPLGGKTLIFDVWVVDLSEAPQQPGRPQVGGGR